MNTLLFPAVKLHLNSTFQRNGSLNLSNQVRRRNLSCSVAQWPVYEQEFEEFEETDVSGEYETSDARNHWLNGHLLNLKLQSYRYTKSCGSLKKCI